MFDGLAQQAMVDPSFDLPRAYRALAAAYIALLREAAGRRRASSMRITLLTYGTRGDVQPYAVLGQHLARRGHDVTGTACTNLVAMAEQAGLGTVPIPIDSQEFLASERGRAILAAREDHLVREGTRPPGNPGTARARTTR